MSFVFVTFQKNDFVETSKNLDTEKIFVGPSK